MIRKNLYTQIFTVFIGIIAIVGGGEATYGLIYTRSPLGLHGHFDHPAGFVAFLSILLPFALFFCKRKSKSSLLFGSVVSCIIFIAILLSRSRAGLLAASIAVLLFFRPLPWSIQRLSLLRRFIILCIGSILFLIGGFKLYVSKKNSADGRLLIWRNSLTMIADQPLTGHGKNGFYQKYMFYQAHYFTLHPQSPEAYLADNINHPFNEYLLLLIRYGIFVFFGFVILSFIYFYYLIRDHSLICKSVLSSFTAIGILSCFSYPFYYSTILIFMIFMVGITVIDHFFKQKSAYFGVLACMYIFCLVFLLPYKIPDTHLYNAAVNLNKQGKYAQSISAVENYHSKCVDIYSALLMANNYYGLKKFKEAEYWATLAHNMCPNRFTPLYQLFNIYIASNNLEQAKKIGREIIEKREKVSSYKIKHIKGVIEHKLKKLQYDFNLY